MLVLFRQLEGKDGALLLETLLLSSISEMYVRHDFGPWRTATNWRDLGVQMHLDLMVIMGPFQLTVFYDSFTPERMLHMGQTVLTYC